MAGDSASSDPSPLAVRIAMEAAIATVSALTVGTSNFKFERQITKQSIDHTLTFK